MAGLKERDVLALLQARYDVVAMGARRYTYAEHVPIVTLFPGTIADAVVVDCWKGSGSHGGHELHGFEVKTSRADWRHELRRPEKSEPWRSLCHRWWLVTSGPKVASTAELPPGWGLMVARETVAGWGLLQAREAPRLVPEPMPWGTTVALIRATQRTVARYAARGEEIGP